MKFNKAISEETKQNWEKLCKEKGVELEDLEEIKEFLESNRDIPK